MISTQFAQFAIVTLAAAGGAGSSKEEAFHQINIEKIEASSNIFTFLLSIFKTFKKSKISYLIISITPYTFFSYLILFLFRKKIFVYLRSNGYEEYKAIFGSIGPARLPGTGR